MSLYTLAAASLTTHDDRRRRPAIDLGQLKRTLVLCLVFAAALVVMVRHGHPQRDGVHAAFFEGARTRSAPARG